VIPRPTRTSPRVPRLSIVATLAACLAASLLGATATVSRAQSGPVEDLATFPRATLEIHGRSGSHRFEVWVADTENRQTQGLMFVRDLPEGEGMLFTNCCNGIWMKNTYIELDILFIGPHHRVVKIAARAKPFDLTTISAGGPVSAVVELKGGAASDLGLKIGDRVDWRMTSQPAK
jgi:uncharacterized protein